MLERPALIGVPRTVCGREALSLLGSGICSLPILLDGSKSPEVKWTPYQTRRPTVEEISAWHRYERGLAVVTGAVSGNLVVLDFDAPDLWPLWCALVGAVLDKLVCMRTPRSWAAWYRTPLGIPAERKLAMGLRVHDESGVPKYGATIELRSGGLYQLVPPSPGAAHPVGRPYTYVHRTLAEVQTLSWGEHSLLCDAARSLSRPQGTDVPEERPVHQPADPSVVGKRPGDAFNREYSWTRLLEPRGWRYVCSRGETEYWCRPGKSGWREWSATVNHGGTNRLHVFSTSCLQHELCAAAS